MKRFLFALFLVILPGLGNAQEIKDMEHCTPLLYNKIDSLITWSAYDRAGSRWMVECMRIDSLKHSMFGDQRFTSVFSEVSDFLFGDPYDTTQLQFAYSLSTRGDDRLLSYLAKNKNKIRSWERSIPKGHNGYLVVARIHSDGRIFRMVFGINKRASEVLWLTDPAYMANWISVSDLLRGRKITKSTTEPYTLDSVNDVFFGPLPLRKESKFNIDNILEL